jgi:hypothetical protein
MSPFYWGLAALAVMVLFLVGWSRFFNRVVDPPNAYTVRREWQAICPTGQAPLGWLTYGEALYFASRLGKVSHVDMEYGFIFYDTHLGGPPPNDGPGIQGPTP